VGDTRTRALSPRTTDPAPDSLALPTRKSLPVTATDRSTDLINAAAQAAADKLAHDVVAYDVSDVLAITDAFLLASAPNDRQVKAIVDEIEERLLKELGAKPVRREGERDGRWVLLDFVDIVVHVQHSEERVFYALERLWKDCPQLDLPEEAKATHGKSRENAGQDQPQGSQEQGGSEGRR
jgi:ribosome-associated protein